MRGINKLVMEVKSDGEYFEKALLFIKPGNEDISQKEISDNAERLLKRIEAKERNKISKRHNIAAPFLWSGAGAVFTWIIMLIVEYLN